MSQTIIYFKNVDYSTTEEELAEFLSDFKVKSVIIPNHTVRFSSSKRRPLGIAYAEVEDAEEGQKLVKIVNNSMFKGRAIYAKLHVPFVPRSSKKETPAVKSSVETAEQPAVKQAVSEDTVFITSIRNKVTDADLRVHFSEFHPSQIYVFTEGKRRGFRHRKSALVTFKTSVPLADIIKQMSGKRICHGHVELRPAYLSKIEKVAAADERRLALLARKAKEAEISMQPEQNGGGAATNESSATIVEPQGEAEEAEVEEAEKGEAEAAEAAAPNQEATGAEVEPEAADAKPDKEMAEMVKEASDAATEIAAKPDAIAKPSESQA